MPEAFTWIQEVLKWFFPPELLADPLVALLNNAAIYIFGWWFLGMLVFKPIVWFLRWLGQLLKG